MQNILPIMWGSKALRRINILISSEPDTNINQRRGMTIVTLPRIIITIGHFLDSCLFILKDPIKIIIPVTRNAMNPIAEIKNSSILSQPDSAAKPTITVAIVRNKK